jgi:hypothetical protein
MTTEAGLSPCIYCGSTEPPREKREHVVPQSYGLFQQNWTLDCVCDGCNQYFGDKLELILGRDSSESILRLKYGLKPPKAAGDLLNRRIEITIETDGPWRGARAFLSMDLPGTGLELLPFPQAGFRRPLQPDFEWIQEAELNAGRIAAYLPKGTEYKIIGPTDEDLLRIDQRLKDLGFKPIQQRRLDDTIARDNNVTFAAEMTFDVIAQRAIAKIAFNYAAKVLGGDFMRHESFDPTRHFIRYAKTPTGYQVTTPTFQPILADDLPLERQTNAHLLIVEWDRSQLGLQARVSLFNELTYVVRLCRKYRGVGFDVATGHLFDPFAHQIVKLTNVRLIRPVKLVRTQG